MLSQAIQQVLFTRPLEKEVPGIVKKYGGSLYIPSPANCFQDSAGTTPCTVDSPVGLLLDTANPVLNSNLFKNTGFVGGVAGSPGTAPTALTVASAPTGITRTLAYGITADGKAYVDITYSGTNTSGVAQYPGIDSTRTTNPAVSGQTYTVSAELALISGSWPTGASIQVSEFNSSSGYLTGTTTSIKTTVTTSTLTKVSHTRTLNNASTAYVAGYPVTFTINNNEAVNFTVRIANPQLELSSTATNFVPNTYMGYSVNQIQGNHATQGTAGFKPILRGKVKNLLTYSEQLNNSAWSKVRSSITSDAVLAPNNSVTADKIVVDTTATSTHRCDQVVTLTSSTVYTLSFCAKAGEYNSIVAEIGNASISVNYVSFNLTNGTYSATGSILSASINSLGNGWYACKLTATPSLTTQRICFGIGLDESYTYTGDGVSGLYLWGAQLELGSTANPYIPTTSAAASSSYGPYWLDFDGTDDRLQLGSVPFQLQDDPFAVVGAFIRYSTTVNGRIIDTGSTSARIQILSNNTTGYLGVGFTDDTTASQFLTEAVNSTNTYNVHTLYKLKDVKLNRRNSQQKAINTTALSVSTCTASHIGCAYSPAAFTGMQLYSIALGKGAPLKDISKIEKYAAKLSGAQL